MRATRLSSCIAAFGPIALVAMAAAGCSSSTPSSSSSSPPSGAPIAASGAAGASVSPSPTGLAARLLTPKDLPGGWAVDVTPANPTMQTDCPLFNPLLWDASLPERGEADLSQGMTPTLVETVGDGTSDQVDKAWQSLAGNLSHCTTYTHSGAAGSSTLALAKAELPKYGDSSYAFTLDVTISGGIHASGNVVAARSGNSIVISYIAGINGVSKSVVENVVSVAVAKART